MHLPKAQFLYLFRASLLGCCALTLFSCAAYAHAQFKDSQPPVGALLEAAPARLALHFSEALELRFSHVLFYNDQQHELPHPTLSIDPQDPTTLIVVPPTLSQGTYTVAWQAASAVDGHLTKGAFPLSIGAISNDALAQTSQNGDVAWGRVLVRWLGFAGLLVWLGSLIFSVYVMQDAEPPIPNHLKTLARWGVGLTALAELLDFIYQAALFDGVPWTTALAPGHWLPLLGVRYGQLAAVRLTLGLVALGWTWHRVHRWGVLLLGVAVVAVRTWSGHNAALEFERGWALAADGLHLLALGAWVGGLVALLWLRPLYARSNAWGLWLARFSKLALLGVGVTVLTGVYMAARHLPQWDALWREAYGQAILAKALLLAGALVLGAVNLLRNVPALQRALGQTAQRAFQRLQRVVGAEVVITGVILVFGALLTLTAPAASDHPPRPQIVESQTLDLEGQAITLTLTVSPAHIGPTTLSVRLTDPEQNAVEAQRVFLTIRYADQDLGDLRVVLTPDGNGLYSAMGTFFGLTGQWQVAVTARFKGRAKDLQTAFELTILDTEG